MPFIVIPGTFRLLSRTKNGNPRGFEPDGDSLQFKPSNPDLLNRLTKLVHPYRLSAIGSTQLRFEGIDALEIHFLAGKGCTTHQPKNLAEEARNQLTKAAGLDPVTYKQPKNTVVIQAPHDGASGFILSRSLDVHGRPVAFVFTGAPPKGNRENFVLNVSLLKKSLNYKMLLSGEAYPLFYDTLFYDLRDALGQAAVTAQTKQVGLWKSDVTTRGVNASKISTLENDGVIFPKLFRRLTEFLAEGSTLPQFMDWIEAKQEPVLELKTRNFTHFENFIKVKGNIVKMTKAPVGLVFSSAKGKAAWV